MHAFGQWTQCVITEKHQIEIQLYAVHAHSIFSPHPTTGWCVEIQYWVQIILFYICPVENWLSSHDTELSRMQLWPTLFQHQCEPVRGTRSCCPCFCLGLHLLSGSNCRPHFYRELDVVFQDGTPFISMKVHTGVRFGKSFSFWMYTYYFTSLADLIYPSQLTK